MTSSGFSGWTRRRFGLAAGGLLTTVLGRASKWDTAAEAGKQHDRHAKAHLEEVGGSGVSGFVIVQQLPNDKGSHIVVVANRLEPGEDYLSLYYDNTTCALEPYSEDDVIGEPYTANAAGRGHTQGRVEAQLQPPPGEEEINSVSVRRASDFSLVACAVI